MLREQTRDSTKLHSGTEGYAEQVIKLYAFGDPDLHAVDGTRLDGLVRQTKRFALLIYLAGSEDRAPRRRDDLIATFWPEADKARGLNALRQSLFVIRRELGPEIMTGNGSQEVSVNWDLLISDIDAFCRALRGGSPETALRIYKGEFLSGFHVSDTPEFGYWVDERRARFRDLASRAAENLARNAEAQRFLSDAIYWWRRALELNPYDEPTLCRIMALLAGSGNRGAALAEFERFRRRAENELGVELSSFTRDLAAKAANGTLADTPQWIGDRRGDGKGDSWSRFRRATDRAAS